VIAALSVFLGALVLFALPSTSLASSSPSANAFGDHGTTAVWTPRVASNNCASKTGFAKIVCLANAERDTTIAQARTARTSAKNACALKSAIEQSTCSDLATASYDYKTAVAKAKAVRAVAKAKCKRPKSVRARSACNVAAANRFLAAVSRATSAKVAA
jgi:hypothetical protein